MKKFNSTFPRDVLLYHKPKDWAIPWQVYALDGCYLAGFKTEEMAKDYCAMHEFKLD